MNVACGIGATVDWKIACQLCRFESKAFRLQESLSSTTASSARLLPETTLDAAEWVASADLIGVDTTHTPVEFAQGAAVDLLAFRRCQLYVVAVCGMRKLVPKYQRYSSRTRRSPPAGASVG
jgi:hypothetical protein